MTLPALPLYTTTQGLTIRSSMLLALSSLTDASVGDLLDLDVSADVIASMLIAAAQSNSKFRQFCAISDAHSEGFASGLERGREIYAA
jgi:hypothetical protein